MILFGLAGAARPVAAADEFVVPPLTGPVVDNGGFLSLQAYNQLDNFLRALKNHGQAQVQVLTVESLNGEPIESASIKVFDKWKLGTANSDNGVLLMIARQERRMRIEVGRGLEGVLTDLQCSHIIDEMGPYFRADDNDTGIKLGVARITALVDPQMPINFRTPRRYSARETAGYFKLGILILFLLFHLIFRRRGFFWGGPFIGGGWGGGGGFGGGGWSGGGGGGNGGGASGGW